jgi:hypothetical protein
MTENNRKICKHGIHAKLDNMFSDTKINFYTGDDRPHFNMFTDIYII